MQQDAPSSDSEYFTARDIARATGWHKKQVHRIAARAGWPTRQNQNRLEYSPPQEIADILIGTPQKLSGAPLPTVTFADLAHSDQARDTVLLRERAVTLLQNNLHQGKELALQLVCNHMRDEAPLFHCSVSSLRRWVDAYAAAGIDGLVDQKRGRVGRKSFAADLDEQTILRTAAAAVEHGIKGRLNVARAYRGLVSDPTVAGTARQWLHGAHASKSYVVPSVRDQLRRVASPLATKLIQVGPKAMKLDGPYTECTYDNVRAGQAFTADDMTANAYVWVDWPNEQGFLLIRPQILAAMDIGTMTWLNIRAVMRPRGQYTKDDVWGLIGDVLDKYGLFDLAVLEGGTWQSNVVRGFKTNLDDDSRFGGLRALGCKVIHTRTPRGKIIETAFNSLQHAADNCPGFCGRMEMKDCPESVKKQIYDCEHGHSHPREHFLHISQYTDHLAGVMKALNEERNDGKILRGQSPFEKWTAEFPQDRKALPDSSKWLYRSAYSIREVTRNGVRVTIGTGKFQTAYTYSAPELEIHRGRRVVIWWNDYDPDTSAVIYSLRSGRPDKLICVAPRVHEIPRFGANQDQMRAETTRKSMARQLAVTQSRALAPYLRRTMTPEPAPAAAHPIAAQIQRARARREQAVATQRQIQREVNRAAVDASDVAAILEIRRDTTEAVSQDEITELFRTDRTPVPAENLDEIL